MHAAVGAWVATSVPAPLLAIDDTAYLALGRTIAGDGAAPIGAQPPYGALYPVLLAPGWLVGLDEAQMITYAQVGNAVLGALLVPVLYVLVRRLTDTARSTAIASALVGASLPAAFLTGGLVWTERLLPLLVALGLLGVVRLTDDPTGRDVALVVAAAVALFATHPRTGAAALVFVGAAVWFAFQAGRIPASAAAAALGLSGLRLAALGRSWLADAAFGDPGTYDTGDLVARRGIDDVPGMVIHGGGTIAYLLLATAGLALLGALVLVTKPQVGVVVGAMTVGVVGVAGWFLTGVDRSDAWLHGRYVEILAPPLVALGVVAAKELPWRISATFMTVGIVASGFYGAWAGPGNNWTTPRTPVMMLGTEVSGAPFGGDVFEPGAAATVALVVGLGLLAAIRLRNRAGVALAAGAVALGVASGLPALDRLHENSIAGQVRASRLGEADIDLMFIDADRVSSPLAAAVAWEVGFGRATVEPTTDATHLLLPAADGTPPQATAVVEFPADPERGFTGGTVWALG